MWRIFIIVLAGSLCGSCSAPPKTVAVFAPLDGTWIPIEQEIAGTAIPATEYADQQLIISDTNYTVLAENVDKGVIKQKGQKLDIYGREGPNAGKHFTAIYKFENELLTVCYNLTGKSYPTVFETRSSQGQFLSVFKKAGD